MYRLLSSFARKEFCIIIIIFILIVVTHRALHINTTTFHRLMSRAKMSPSSSSSSKKLSQLVSAIKSSDPVRTRALCDDITFDINDAVECDSDGEDDFPLQVALGKRIWKQISSSSFSLSPSLFFSVLILEKEEKERSPRENKVADRWWCLPISLLVFVGVTYSHSNV